ncbi:hypothetical protein VOLCADRAFT_118411 [Volvox carteri f. nagariensis]|uniref:Uncharacterized protein n=1 Tax=Volvox carteri f. nagariensis TaxID=3068 RepID=D8U4Q2_VOLCA|nr:uncharacterized protein VOLCADRAFT_118411 [Volvox carteri f. nagariensis]EFJ45227.1 hypothetical protein VOLCADRAFT_118411 [Volvox carteri f. nagariensis]|eukprot:XP_002953603.1 hypothetical protein VOLCADRAFT_118411 [Volvox carteri f. nagariensis]
MSLGPKRPIRGLSIILPLASAAVSISLDVNPEKHRQPAQDQPESPAAPLAVFGQQLVANCAAASLVIATFQVVANYVNKARDAVAAALPAPSNSGAQQEWQQQVKELRKHTRLLAFVLPLAKAFAAESLTSVYARTFERAAFGFAKMYLFCLFMRVLLSWFPSIDWNAQPWAFLRLITEPYLQIYRGILPPLFGQLDFTPLFGFLILQDVVELMSPVYTLGHARDTSMYWTTSDIMCYFDGH